MNYFRKQDNVVTRRIVGETLLIPIRGNLVDMDAIFALDPTADFIWGRIAPEYPLERIVGEVVGAFDVDRHEAATDVAAFLAELEEAGIIVGVA